MGMKKYIPKVLIVLFVVVALILAKNFGLADYLTLDYLKTNHLRLQDYHLQNKFLSISFYMLIYILTSALSLPGATILSLGGGAIFGFWTGLIVVSFASTIGATLAFWGARFLFRDYIQNRFGERLKVFNQGIEKEGAFYLFTLRVVPVIPFFVINLVMGLTPIKTGTYFLVSQVGMILGTAVYINAGLQLSQINTLKDILSPTLIASFALLGVLPFAAKKIIKMIQPSRS